MSNVKYKRFYLTKRQSEKVWYYIGDAEHPFTTLDAGMVEVNTDDIRVDKNGNMYIDQWVVYEELKYIPS